VLCQEKGCPDGHATAATGTAGTPSLKFRYLNRISPCRVLTAFARDASRPSEDPFPWPTPQQPVDRRERIDAGWLPFTRRGTWIDMSIASEIVFLFLFLMKAAETTVLTELEPYYGKCQLRRMRDPGSNLGWAHVLAQPQWCTAVP
jgi:hypothetical protein